MTVRALCIHVSGEKTNYNKFYEKCSIIFAVICH